MQVTPNKVQPRLHLQDVLVENIPSVSEPTSNQETVWLDLRSVACCSLLSLMHRVIDNTSYTEWAQIV